jgi:ribose 1,5-bisphosphokinase
MTDGPTPATEQPSRLGPGRLVLVVGPSGAGKDTLLNLARAECAMDHRIVFPRRIVTRQASAFEDNEEMDSASFRRALAEGRFAVHWEAHGHRYALPRAIDNDVRNGRTVVVNVSRTVIAALRRAYAHVVVVMVTAPEEVLAARLAGRHRSSDGDIEARLHRAIGEEASIADVTIVNVGDPHMHAHVLAKLIKGVPAANAIREEEQDVDHRHD